MEQKIRADPEPGPVAAVLIPPLPPLLLGLVVFGFRVRRENLGANPNRLA